jgi:glycosyltransferase involved in cell wall biosynthesis
MTISVIIPAYNEEAYIKKCLASVMDQKVKASEVIVVNNNSNDKTSLIASEMGAKVVNEKVQGMIPARNRGFDEATGDIIARIDADTLVPSDWLKRIKTDFESHEYDALTGPIVFGDLFKKPTSTLPSKIYLETLRIMTRGRRYLQGPSMYLTKDIWLKVRENVSIDESKVHEDLDLSLKIIKAKGKIGFDPDLIVQISARRIKSHPESFLVEYPIRILKTFWENRT